MQGKYEELKTFDNLKFFFSNNSLAYISTQHAIRHLTNTRKKPMLQFEEL